MKAESVAYTHNGVLATLPQGMVSQLELPLIPLVQRDVLYRAGEQIEYLYFVERGIISLITIMSDGGTSEGGMIGTEGVLGFPALLGSSIASQHGIVQLPGFARRMPIAIGNRLFAELPLFRAAALRFVSYLTDTGLQTAACNRLHPAAQRAARWLLMMDDRVPHTLQLTQEFLAAMLGVRRTGFTVIAQALRRLGLIEYSHGSIRITDREGLQAVACECYARDWQRFHQSFGDQP